MASNQARVWLITGASSGFGRAIAEAALAAGDTVVAAARRTEALADLVASAPDRVTALSLDVTDTARINVAVNERTGPIYQILVSAACSEPDAADLLAQYTQQRQQGQGQIARALARAGALRAGLRERDAAYIVHVFMSPEVYRLLVRDRGWSRTRYQRWLESTLVQQLLPTTTD